MSKDKNFPILNPANPDVLEQIKKATIAKVAIGRTGPRYRTETYLKLREETAIAKDAIWSEISDDFAEKIGGFMIQTGAKNKREYLIYPEKGKKFTTESVETIKQECKHAPQVQVVVVDGLSVMGIEKYAQPFLQKFTGYLKEKGLDAPNPSIVVKYGRVGVTDSIGDILCPEVTVLLIGERPGFAVAESMGCYITYKPRKGLTDANRDALCNIWRVGTIPEEAAKKVADIVEEAIKVKKYTGVKV
jgi:ethanolamine ammonia-lyase small subunit